MRFPNLLLSWGFYGEAEAIEVNRFGPSLSRRVSLPPQSSIAAMMGQGALVDSRTWQPESWVCGLSVDEPCSNETLGFWQK